VVVGIAVVVGAVTPELPPQAAAREMEIMIGRKFRIQDCPILKVLTETPSLLTGEYS